MYHCYIIYIIITIICNSINCKNQIILIINRRNDPIYNVVLIMSHYAILIIKLTFTLQSMCLEKKSTAQYPIIIDIIIII